MSDLICYRRKREVFHGFLEIVFAHGRTFLGYRTFRNRKDSKFTASCLSVIYCLDDLIRVIRYLGYKDDVGAARHTGIERKPAYLMSHYFHQEYPSVTGSCRMYKVYCVGGNINGTLESESHIGAV